MEVRGQVAVSASADGLMQAAADHFVRAATTAIDASGRFVVALSGGSTPKGLYALLAAEPRASLVSWRHVHVCWSDERCAAPDAADSNYRMAREALLDLVPLPSENIHRIHGEDDPASAAAAYERELRALFRTPAGPPRMAAGTRFDLVLLGMGDNGHTASLFPNLAAVREERRWVMAEFVPEVSMWRITLTPVAINAATDVAFLVSGSGKAAMLARVLHGPFQSDELPAQAINPRTGRLRWFVDKDAAAFLVQ